MIPKNFLFIALKYLQIKQQDNSIKSMIKVCFLGICLATCALALIISVMAGFESATHQKIQSIYPDLILDSNNQAINMKALQPILQENQYHIKHYSEQGVAQALLHNTQYSNAPVVICLKGINPSKEQLVNTLHTKTIAPTSSNSLTHIIQSNKIFIGSKLAQNLNVSCDDQLELLYTDDEPEQLKVTFKQTTVTIGGTFKTGIDEFDSNVAYCSLDLFNSLFPEQGTSQVYLKLQDKSYENETIQLLQNRLNVDVYSWKHLYPALVSALKLEKYAMFFILLLIVVIASMNIISLIFMYITQKNKDIALLICFGMPLRKIKTIFICISLILSILATTAGLTIAYFLGKIIERYPCISLPDDAYLLTHLPIKLDPVIFCVIFISSIIITLYASIVSTKKINKINIVQILKHE